MVNVLQMLTAAVKYGILESEREWPGRKQLSMQVTISTKLKIKQSGKLKICLMSYVPQSNEESHHVNDHHEKTRISGYTICRSSILHSTVVKNNFVPSVKPDQLPFNI